MEDSLGLEKFHSLVIQDIVLSATASSPNSEIIAFVVRSGDLILYSLKYGEKDPVVRWIPWFDDVEKKLSAIAFNPDGGDALLLSCYDQSFYVVPTSLLLTVPSSGEDESKAHDVFKLPNPFVADDGFVPSAIAWWVRHAAGDSTRHCAIVGSTNGQVVVFALYTGVVLFTTLVNGHITKIDVYSKPEQSYIVITNIFGKQWRISLVESLHQVGSKTPDNTLEKKFSSLSINVVDSKSDTRPKKPKSSSPLRVEFTSEERIYCKNDVKLHITMQSIGEQMLHVNCHSIICSYSSSFVTVERSSYDQVLVHKLPENTQFLSLTNSFFFCYCESLNAILVISRNLTSHKTDRQLFNAEFNKEAIVQQFVLSLNERLINIFSSSHHDQCFIITTLGVYVIQMKKDPQDLALNSILTKGDLREAEKLSIVFGLDLQRLICQAAGIKLAQGSLEEAKSLYSLSPTGGVHQVMMFAITGHFRELLDLLQSSKLASANKCQIMNLKLLLFIHQILLNREDRNLIMELREVLVFEDYDEIQAMRILCQVFMFGELRFMMRRRGMQQSVLPALMTLVPTLDLNQLKGFWELMSDSTLTETLITRQAFAAFHANLVLKYIHTLPLQILLNLEKLYNPYQTTVRNFFSNVCKGDLPKKVWVETYLSICFHLSSSYGDTYQEDTLAMASYGHVWEVEQPRVPYVRKNISAGFRHASVILKGIAYGWGWSVFGCLGFGPSSQPVGGPKSVDVLMNVKKTVISISCGKHHTIALTNDGVYTWGSNRYGQLGTGNTVQAWHPTRIEILSSFRVVSVCAGQYHSMALDDMNRVFSFGWGVHGQLGHGSVDDIYSPKIITFLSDKGVISFSAGQGHSLFLDAEGRVWACGNNTFGQLGIGEMKKSSIPLQIYGFTQRMCSIEAGYFQNVAISHEGKLYQWGRSPTVLRSAAHSAKRRVRLEECPREQQTDEGAEHMIPKLVDTSTVQGRIVEVSVGNEHCVAISDNGSVYAWGRNIDGQLGILATLAERRTQYITAPVPVPIDAKIVSVACGWNFTIALDDEEKVWTWGAIHPFKGMRGTKLAGLEGEIVVVNNKNRVIKLPHSGNNVHPVPTILTINHQNKEQVMFSPAKLPSHLINSHWRLRMHFTLEQLGNYYDTSQAIKKCLSLDEHDACSKLTFLSGDYATSIYEKLVTTKLDSDRITVVNYYLSHDFPDGEVLKKMLAMIVKYWRDNKINMKILEEVFILDMAKIAQPLGVLLFGSYSNGNESSNFFSTAFKVNLVKQIASISSDNFDCIFDGFNSTEDVVKALENADEFIDINFVQIKDTSSSSKERRFFSL